MLPLCERRNNSYGEVVIVNKNFLVTNYEFGNEYYELKQEAVIRNIRKTIR